MSAKVQSILVGAAPKSAATRQKVEKQASFEYHCSIFKYFKHLNCASRRKLDNRCFYFSYQTSVQAVPSHSPPPPADMSNRTPANITHQYL
jgi:hypothetical protein